MSEGPESTAGNVQTPRLLVDAPPPDQKEKAPPGFYEDPLGSARLRQWDGSRWTDSVRKLQVADAQPASAYKRCRLLVPRPFPFADSYRVVEDDGCESLTVPGGRWFYRQLRVCDAEGTEMARMRRKGHWWWEDQGYDVLQGGVRVAFIDWERLFPVDAPDGTRTFIVSDRGERAFIREKRIVARLIDQRQLLRRRTHYDLDLALDVDPIQIVAACVGLDQMDRQWLGVGGGGG